MDKKFLISIIGAGFILSLLYVTWSKGQEQGIFGGQPGLATNKDYQLTVAFKGYVTKPDPTNTDSNYLIDGSQNVLINDSEKIGIRNGYSLFGQASGTVEGIQSSFVWKTSRGDEWFLRSHGDKLEFYDSVASSTWVTIRRGDGEVDYSYTTWWDNTEKIDLLLFARGASTTFADWSGAVTQFSSATTNTITKTGTTTWAQQGFLLNNTRQVHIGNIIYTYTGGENTLTLTGVSPDPTLGNHYLNQLVFQETRTNSNLAGLDAGFNVDSLGTLNNQVYLCSQTSRRVFVSKNTSFSDYTFSSPRIPGDGAVFTLDDICNGLIPQENDMYIFAGRNDIFKTNFTVVGDANGIREDLQIKKLKTGPLNGGQEQDLILKAKNSVIYLDNEPALLELAQVESAAGQQLRTISDPIKPTIDGEIFEGGDMEYFRNQIFMVSPKNSMLYIYDIAKGYWQPPQVLPFSKLSVYQGNIYGHSAAIPETYLLFDGTNDNGNSIYARAIFPYNSYGQRAKLKSFTDYYVEGYLSSNTNLDVIFRFDYQGAVQSITKTIAGNDNNLLFRTLPDDSLGTHDIGAVSLSGDILAGDSNTPKFRTILALARRDYFELSVEFTSNDVDQIWELLAHGPNASLSGYELNRIRQ